MSSTSHKTLIACFTVVKNSRGRILFMRRSINESFESGKWDFPGGSKEYLETMEEGAIRECKEESSLDVTIEKLIKYNVTKSRTEQNTEFVVFFFLSKPKNENVVLSDEHDDFRWLTIQEAKRLPLIYWMEDFLDEIETGKMTI